MRAVFVGNRNAGRSARFRDGDTYGGYPSLLDGLAALPDHRTMIVEARRDIANLQLAIMSANRCGKPTDRLDLQLEKATARLHKLENPEAA